MNSINVEIKRTSDGRVDVKGTLASWSNDLHVFASKEEADLDTIATAVDSVLADRPEAKSLQMDAIVSYTIAKIPGADQAFNEVSTRIKNYVRNQTELFCLTKGKNGGVNFLSRLTEEERAKALSQRDRATAKAAAKAA